VGSNAVIPRKIIKSCIVELNSKIIAIVQARMGSIRLPGKVLKSIQGKPMLWHIVNRLRKVDFIDDVVIATSDRTIDDIVEKIANEYGISFYRGSESDVLKRFYDAAKTANAEHVIRITGDCPLIDSPTISKLIKLYFNEGYDFCGVACGAGVANKTNINRFPDGLDAEIFSFQVLQEAHNEAFSELHREHVTPFIWQNKERYSLGTLYPENGDYSQHRWTVDNEEDFQFIKWVYDMKYLQKNDFNMYDILDLLKKHPNATKKNKHLIGQEGYEEFWN